MLMAPPQLTARGGDAPCCERDCASPAAAAAAPLVKPSAAASNSLLFCRLPHPSSADSWPLALTPNDPRLPKRLWWGLEAAAPDMGGGVRERPKAAAKAAADAKADEEGGGVKAAEGAEGAPAEGGGVAVEERAGASAGVGETSERSEGLMPPGGSLEPGKAGGWEGKGKGKGGRGMRKRGGRVGKD